ncbi:hypothetical protein ACVBEQ_10280 [Nakamurella sp. GG22]
MITALQLAAAAPAVDPCTVSPPTSESVQACVDANTTNLGEQIGGVVGAVGDAATSVAGSAVGAGIQWVIDWIQEAMADVAVSVASFWTSTPTVSVGSVDGSASPTVGWIQDALRNYTVILAVISLVFGGVYLAIKGRVTLPQLGIFLFRIAAAGALTTAVCAALIGAADDFSEWIIPAASNGSDLGANLAALFANPITGPVGLVCLILELLSSLFLVAMMWVRSAMLVLLVGTVGLAAVMWSPTYFARHAKAIVALVLVKPLAALIFAVGFRLLGSDVAAQGVTEAIVGAVILLSACWSWKFLVKVVAPFDDPLPQTGLGGAVARAAAFAALVAK